MNRDLLYILSKILEGIDNSDSFEKIADTVKPIKISKNIIAAIYSWIFEKLTRDSSGKNTCLNKNQGMRIFSEEEIEIIGLDNYNYILHLYNIGLLNNADIEKIIEQAYSFPEGELDLEQLNLMVLSIFLEINSELPPGSRLLLHSSDKIN